jgi:ComF family protein
MTREAASAVRRLWATSRYSKWPGVGLDLIFPPECAHCRQPIESSALGLLCAECRSTLVDRRVACPRCGSLRRASADADCLVCRDERFAFESVLRLGPYEGVLRLAVLRIKRPEHRALALALGDLAAGELCAALAAWQPDAVVPIPMHWSRRMWRGANSPHSIGQRLAAHLSIPLADHLLVRRRRTAAQVSLSPRQRRANVRGAFRARAHRDLPGARLLLVDDVMTTGATVHEAAKTLVQSGAAAVAVVVLARAEGL